MFHAFKQRSSAKGSVENDKHTRFKRTHLRENPVQEQDCGIDPYEGLRRGAPYHKRTPTYVEAELQPVLRPMFAAALDERASLHSSEPIAISVLHSALPLRAAQVVSKK